MFLAWLIIAGGIAVVLVLGWSLAVSGLRAGDQAGDATVTAAADAGQVAIAARLARRREDGAGAETVAAPARRYRLTAVVGQAGGRLRVVRIPVVSGGSAGAGRPARAARAGDRG